MSTVLNQDAPPAEAPKGDFVRFEPFPGSDSYVLTAVGTNYLASHPFTVTDEVTKAKSIKNFPAVEFYFGAIVENKPTFVKSWPYKYSIHEKSNYSKLYLAFTGKLPVGGSKPADVVGKSALVELELSDKTSTKGTKYKATKIKTIGKIPKMMFGTETPLAALEAPFKKALAGSNDKPGAAPSGGDEEAPF